MKDRLDLWQSEFGDEYHRRNDFGFSETNVVARAAWLSGISSLLGNWMPQEVLEVGCGVGANLAAWSRCAPGIICHGTEPNEKARAIAELYASSPCFVSSDSAANLGYMDRSFDLVMTCGLLIHIPDEGLADAMREIHRVARCYILCAEYYGRDTEEVPYRGEDGALWRRPYGDLFMKQFPRLKPLAAGFAWKRLTGLDDLCWFLFEKP